MVKMLLGMQQAGDWDQEKADKRLEAAVQSYRAEAMINVLSQHAQQRHKGLRVTSKALEKAARGYIVPKTLNILLKLIPETEKEMIAAPNILKAAARNLSGKSQLKLLMTYAAGRSLDLEIDQAVFEAAMQAQSETAKMILNLWAAKGQSELIETCVTEKALEVAASRMRFLGRTQGSPEQSTFHFLVRMRAEEGLSIPLTGRILEKALNRSNTLRVEHSNLLIEYFERILRWQGGEIKFEHMITTEALRIASCSRGEQLVSQLLNILPEQKRDELLTRDVLLAAAGIGGDQTLKFLLKQKDFQQYKNYYEDISKFHKASWSIFAGKQRILLRRGVYPNAPMLSLGRTMLSIAAGYNELPSLRNFMKFPGFDLDVTDCEGRTALHFACERGAVTAVELLLARGADKTIKDEDGKTADDYATENYHYVVARIVRGYGATRESGQYVVDEGDDEFP